MRKKSLQPLERPGYETSARINVGRFLCSTLFALAGCMPAAHYDYNHLPSGYHWRAIYDRATNAIVFYGRDPLTLETVYVGPDSQFFIFDHPGPIGPNDLKKRWNPHDAR